MRSSRLLLLAAALAAPLPARAGAPAEGAALAQLRAVESAGGGGGRVMERAPSRPNLILAPAASSFGAPKPSQAATQEPRPYVPDPAELAEAQAEKRCSSFFGCLGSGAATAVKLPFLGAGMIGAMGQQFGKALLGTPGGFLGALVGGLIGLAGGLILAPIALLGGVVDAVKSAFGKNPA